MPCPGGREDVRCRNPEAIDWLWWGRIPRGMLTMLDGDPGLGKSTLICGSPPAYRPAAPAGNVAAGADLGFAGEY